MSPDKHERPQQPKNGHEKKAEKQIVQKQTADDALKEKLDIDFQLAEELDGSDYAVFSSLNKTLELVAKLPSKNRLEIFNCHEEGLENLLANADSRINEIEERLENTQADIRESLVLLEPGDYEDIAKLLEEMEFTAKELIIATKFNAWLGKNYQKFCQLSGTAFHHNLQKLVQSEKDAKNTYTKVITYCHSLRLKIDTMEKKMQEKEKRNMIVL